MARTIGDKNLSQREQRLKEQLIAQKRAYEAKLEAEKAKTAAAKLRAKSSPDGSSDPAWGAKHHSVRCRAS